MTRVVLSSVTAAAALLAAVPAASADTLPVVGNTATVTCTFDAHAAPGVTRCSVDEVEISLGGCYPAGTYLASPARLYWHEEYTGTRVYRGNAVLHGRNGVTVSRDFGPVPITTTAAIHAWEDAVYASVIKPHEQPPLTDNDFGTAETLDYPIFVAVDSC